MTVINGIEIDDITYNVNEIKCAIRNNDPIENKLHVILVISNPCLFARRYILFREFMKRMMEEESDVIIYVVEMIYPGQKYIVTKKNDPRHLQLYTTTAIWHKENMINLGVQRLLPSKWKAFAWIDADVEFENVSWASDTLKILNGSKDVVQLFSHCLDMNRENENLSIFNGFGYSFIKKKRYTIGGRDYWHPGYAWAMTRRAYERIGGLYDKGVLGSGDNIMAISYLNKCEYIQNPLFSPDYNEGMTDFANRAKNLRLGYVPGVIRHYFHGSKENRKYTERWKILMKYQYSPKNHLMYDENGILIPTIHFPPGFAEEIMQYFFERKEDD